MRMLLRLDTPPWTESVPMLWQFLLGLAAWHDRYAREVRIGILCLWGMAVIFIGSWLMQRKPPRR